MSEKIVRYGIVTYGKVARLQAKALARVPQARLVGVQGRDQAKARAFAADFGIEAFDSIEAMARGGVEAVIISSPHPLHREHTIAALEAGMHVLVEKPMALSTADCDAMMAAAAASNRRLGVISQRRWFPAVHRVRDAIDAGKIGKPILADVVMFGWRDEAYYRSDPWRGSWAAEGGGVLVNQAPHQLDLMLWMMGPVDEVQAYWANLNHPYIEVEDTAVASIRFKSGALGSILVSNSQKPGIYAKVHIHGSNGATAGVQTDGGMMFIAGMAGIAEPALNDIWTIPGEERLPAVWEAEDRAFFATTDPAEHFHAMQLQDFAQAILDNREPLVTALDGRATVALIEAIYESGRTGKAVKPR
ncbi:MAG TPA: Gfo/Idh/MocA family oxidoreductase [bacterium]|nr:Gfo/Idh/MocA family oxidoreductase [bacterium]